MRGCGVSAGEVRPEIQRRRIAGGVSVMALGRFDPGGAEAAQPAALGLHVVERRIAIEIGGAALEHGEAESEPVGLGGGEIDDVHPCIIPPAPRVTKTEIVGKGQESRTAWHRQAAGS